MRKSQVGVTIPELLVVISIISFLALVSIAYFRSQIFKGNDAKKKADIKRIQIALEEYEKDHNCYPLAEYLACHPGTALKPYLNQIPCDPSTDTSYVYDYEESICPTWYRLYTKLENEADPKIDELGCKAGCGPGLIFNYYATSPNAPLPEKGAGEE